MAKRMKPVIEDGRLSAESVKLLEEWDYDDFDGVTSFVMYAWDKGGVLSKSSRKMLMEVKSDIQKQILAALKTNEDWWSAHWYSMTVGDKYEFRSKVV